MKNQPMSFNLPPLNSVSREECGLLISIVHCAIIEYTNIGADLIEKPRNVHNVKGNGNSHFRCISYALLGCEDYYDNISSLWNTFCGFHVAFVYS